MAKSDTRKDISELIDEVEAIREQLLSIQRSLEEMEHEKTAEPSDQ